MATSNTIYKLKYKKAQAHLQANRLVEAHDILSALCQKFPTKIQVWLDLALIQRKLNRFKQAFETCKHILSINPDSAPGLHLMGSICHCLHSFDDAVSYYQKSLSLNNNNAECHYFLGNTYQTIKNYEAAAESYKNAIKIKPDYLQALSNLGALLIQMRQMNEAKSVLQMAYKLHKNSEHVLSNLAELSLQENHLVEGINYAKQALLINSNFRDGYFILAKLYREDGDLDNALINFNKAFNLDIDNTATIAAMAEIYERRGDIEQSLVLLEPLIDAGTTNQEVITKYAKLARNIDKKQEAIELLERQLSVNNNDALALISIHSELGKLYEAVKNYDDAFGHFKQANDLEIQLNSEYRNNDNLVMSEDLIHYFQQNYNKAYWDSIARSEVESDSPVFIIGMPRSGTTLVEQILSSHPDVYGAGELIYIADIARNLSIEKNIIVPSNTDVSALNQSAKSYISSIASLSESSKYVTDKMPTNFYYLGLISKLLPKAKIIHVERNPLDTCLSILFERFAANMTYTTDAAELAEYYSAYDKLMHYWYEVLDIEIYKVKYEDLVLNQEQVSHDLLKYCEIPWNDACLNFHKNARDVNTPSYDQVRQPIYSSSIGRWKHYKKHITPLIDRLG